MNRKERERRTEEWLIAGHQTKWEPETARCQSCYGFILYLLPWDLPHIHRPEQNKSGGEREMWKSMGTGSWVRQCERISIRGLQRWVRHGGPESERGRVWGENSNISSAGSYLDKTFVLWKEPCTPACTSVHRMLDCNGWAALFCLCPLPAALYLSLGQTTVQTTLYMLKKKGYPQGTYWYSSFSIEWFPSEFQTAKKKKDPPWKWYWIGCFSWFAHLADSEQDLLKKLQYKSEQ